MLKLNTYHMNTDAEIFLWLLIFYWAETLDP